MNQAESGSSAKKTRNSTRTKKFSRNMDFVDESVTSLVHRKYIASLESDSGDSFSKDSEASSEDFNAFEWGKKEKRSKKIAKKGRTKRIILRKNMSLKRVLREEPNCEQNTGGGNPASDKFPGYFNIQTQKPDTACKIRVCSICTRISKYFCPRCMEPYCSLNCAEMHKELKCIGFGL